MPVMVEIHHQIGTSFIIAERVISIKFIEKYKERDQKKITAFTNKNTWYPSTSIVGHCRSDNATCKYKKQESTWQSWH